MNPEGQATPTPTPSPPPPTPPTPGASTATAQTIQTNPKILQSAMKNPTDGFEKLQKQGSGSPRGSLRFLLPRQFVKAREVGIGDEEGGNAGRVMCEEDEYSDGRNDDDSDEEISQRSLLGSRRGIERRKRLGGGVGRGTREGWWRNWTGTLALWVVLIVLGSAMGFVFVENAEEEIPMPEGPGSSEGKRFFSLMPIIGWDPEKEVVGPVAMEEFMFEDSAELMKRGIDLHKREVPDDARWLYDAQDPSYDLVPSNATDRDKLVESRNGAVSSDVEICSEAGVGLMKRGGNAVDAVIGESPGLFCLA